MHGRAPIAVVLLSLAGAVATQAQEAGPKTLAAFPPGSESCYRQSYNAAALRRFAGQTIEEFAIFNALNPDSAKEIIPYTLEEAKRRDRTATQSRMVTMIVKLSDSKTYFEQQLFCSDSEGEIRCGVECDGGSLTAKVSRGALEIDLGEYGPTVEGSCGEGDTRQITRKDAPKGLIVPPGAAQACRQARTNAHQKLIRDFVPLRARVTQDGWRCLKRVYDSAHLAKNPAQTVSTIAVSILETPRVVDVDENFRETHMKVKLSVTLKSGRTAEATEECEAGDYEFRCGDNFRLRRRDDKSALVVSGGFDPEPGQALPNRLAGLPIGKEDQLFRVDLAPGDCP